MKKMMLLGLVMAAVVFMVGCKSFTEKSDSTFYRTDGTVEKVVKEKKTEASPFYYKSMNSILDAIGFNVSFTNPEDGSVSPDVKFRKGSSIMGSIPITSDAENKYEIFGTYKRVYVYSSSMFNFGANTGDLKVSEEAGGIGVLAIAPDGSTDRLNKFIASMDDLKKKLDTQQNPTKQ